jgi:serine/threonine protein kinase
MDLQGTTADDRGVQTRVRAWRHVIECHSPQDMTALAELLDSSVRSNPSLRSEAGIFEHEHEPAEAWIGRVIGKRHRIVRHIASGGMGHVFVAQHMTLGGFVAVKILFAGSDENTHLYFRNEARLLSRLRHPNIVSVFDFATMRSGDCYIVMEWLPGIDLGTFITAHGALEPKRALWILTQLAAAVDFVHSRGVMHRDIKPENVVFCPSAHDVVKLLDFGVAIPFGAPPQSEYRKLIGTPLYMAPEQANGMPSSPSTDLYALGAVALELLTGNAPYERLSAAEIVQAVLSKAPSSPSESGIHVLGLDAVIAHALARDPKARFSTGFDFVLALREVLRGHRRTVLNASRPHSGARWRAQLRGTVVMPSLGACLTAL